MRVQIAEDVFDAAAPLEVSELIGIARHGRHDILLSPTFYRDDERDLPRMRWLNAQSAAMRNQLMGILEIAAERASRRSPRMPTIRVIAGSVSRWADGMLTVDDALAFLQAPLRLLLENKNSDWQFLLAMATSPARTELEDARTRRWVEIEGGGLGELKKRILEMMAHRAKHQERYRTWVMFDRDADVDPREASRESRDVAKLCRDAELPHLQLGRRSIENYLPVEAMRGRGRVGQRDALMRLREQHVAESFCYSMKQGFIKDATLPGPERNRIYGQWKDTEDASALGALVPTDALPDIWRSLPADLQGELLFGFGDKVGEEFQRVQTETNWEEWFTREYSRGPAGQRDAHDVINEILELL